MTTELAPFVRRQQFGRIWLSSSSGDSTPIWFDEQRVPLGEIMLMFYLWVISDPIQRSSYILYGIEPRWDFSMAWATVEE